MGSEMCIRDSYQTDVNENKFIIKGDGQAEDGGVGINKEAIQF